MREEDNELRRRLSLLKEKFERGQIKISSEIFDSVAEDLRAVKNGVDGLIDLSTVSSSVRALASAISYFDDREELKKSISLSEIQRQYFDMIDANFGHYYKVMCDRELTPHDVASSVAANSDEARYYSSKAVGFIEYIEEFWQSAWQVCSFHVEDLQSLKSVFGGDLFPSYSQNIASRCGVYVDTIVLPDPFFRAKMMILGNDAYKSTYYILKCALNILQYKELALADVDIPIVVVIPDSLFLNAGDVDFLKRVSKNDILAHFNRLFGRSFSSIDEVFDFSKQFTTSDEAIAAIYDKSRALFDVDWSGPLNVQLDSYIDEHLSSFGIEKSAGKALVYNGIGRMQQANDIVLRSKILGGVPLIDAPTSWRYFQWKLEYEANLVRGANFADIHLTWGLKNAFENTELLSDIPVRALIEMRKVGAMQELRSIISVGVSEIIASDPTNFNATSKQVVKNIENAFRDHQCALKKLRNKKLRFAGVDLLSCVVRGGIEIASACGVPFVGLINSIVGETCDLPKFKELPGRFHQLKEDDERFKKSPLGLFFTSYR